MPNKIVVIGCGNLNRCDDGVGVIVVHRLKEWLRAVPHQDVMTFDAGTGGMDVMFQARGASSLILIDACNSGSAPGSVFMLAGKDLANRPRHGYSLHDFRWDHALYAGEKIFGEDFPSDVTIYLVEVADISLGLEVSPLVSQGADKVVECIKNQIRRLTEERNAELQCVCVRIRGGSLYLEANVYAAYFAGLESLVLLRQEDKMLMLPVRHAAAGGLLLKIRTRQGDRVVHAREFLSEGGLDEQQEWTLPAHWDSQCQALVAQWPSGA